VVARAAWFIGCVLLWLAPACASAAPAGEAPDRARLQASLDAARAQAAGEAGLDAAYELIALADAVARSNHADVSNAAVTELLGIVVRASQAAADAPRDRAHDTIDQLLDLKFSAAASGLESVIAALDRAMQRLIPGVRTALAERVEDEDDWDIRMEAATAMSDLQASAAQANLNEEAADVGRAFDAAVARLAESAHSDGDIGLRQARAQAVAELQSIHDERLADAVTNNVRAVAAELRATEQAVVQIEQEGTTEGEDLSLADALAPEDSTCVETGALAASAPLDDAERECVLSGRSPSSARCPTRDLSFVCYRSTDAQETITYVYRDTIEEEPVRQSCADLVESGGVPQGGAPFRNGQMRLAMTCAPAGEQAARN
jgi:hypothetical protein